MNNLQFKKNQQEKSDPGIRSETTGGTEGESEEIPQVGGETGAAGGGQS